MNFTSLLLGASLFLMAHFYVLFRLGRKIGGPEWAIGAACLYLTGIFNGVNHLLADSAWFPLTSFLAPVPSTLFAGMFWLGTMRYLRRPVPAWFLPALIAVALLRGLTQPITPQLWVVGSGSILSILSAALSIYAMLRYKRLSLWTLLFCLGAAGVALVGILFYRSVGSDIRDGLVISAWVLSSIFLGGAQVLLLIESGAERQNRIVSVLQAVLESIPGGVLLIGQHLEPVTVNLQFVQLLGLRKRRELLELSLFGIGNRLSQTMTEESRQTHDAALKAVMRREQTEPFSYTTTEGRDLRLNTRKVLNEHGEEIGYLLFLDDISAINQFNQEQNELRRLEFLMTLTAGLSHDFNNKLGIVSGALEIVTAQGETSLASRRLLKRAKEALDFCTASLRDLLTASSQFKQQARPLDVDAWLEDEMPRLQDCLDAGVELVLQAGARGSQILADEKQLDRLLLILLDNANAALEGEGLIILSTRLIDDGAEGMLELSVQDNGTGIDPAISDSLFDPYSSTREFGLGAGMGLAIAQGVMRAHKGDIRLESEPGQGTTVFTRWPLAASMAEPVQAEERELS